MGIGTFALAVALSAPFALAEEPKKKSPFKMHYRFEIPLLVASVAMTAIPVLFQPEMPETVLQPLDRNRVFFLDRPVTHYNSQAAINVSYTMTAVVPALVVGASLPWGDKGWDESFEDLMLLSESIAFTSLVNQVVRNAFRRPRPYLYQRPNPNAIRDREDLSSFFSGHVATTTSLGIAFWRIRSIRSPGHPANPYILGAALLATTTMAAGRVYSGFHYWTDVFVGATLGGALGFVIPEIHRIDDGQSGSITLAPSVPGGLAVGLRI